MDNRSFDIAILGGGPGGYTAAIKASQLGFSVALIEEKFLGGTCLNIGCIPTKALIHCASLYEDLSRARSFGLSVDEIGFDWEKVQKYKERCVLRLRKGVESLMVKNKIEVFPHHGRLSGENTIDVEGTRIVADHVILAVGSRAKSLPSLPVDGDKVITSDHALSLKEVPERLLIVGAGAIGCEFAYIMSSFGSSVTLVEFLDHALPMEDPDISTEFEAALKRARIKLHTRSSVERIEKKEGKVIATVKPRDGGDDFEVESDKVLVSVGRAAAIEYCGLEGVGIPVEHGYIKVDDRMRTGIGNVRAIGDSVGGLMLAHKASAEGILAVEDIAGHNCESIIYSNVPRATYCRPEVASVGLGEIEARQQYGDSIKISKFPFSAVGKAVAIGETEGFVKLIATDAGTLIGAHAIGPHVTDLIATAATAVSNRMTAEKFAQVVQAHPTLSEVWLESCHGLLGGSINI